MNMRNFLIALTIVAVVSAGGAYAAPVSAFSIGDIQAQIQVLLARVAELTGQLNVLRGQNTIPVTTVVTPVTPITVADVVSDIPRHRVCKILYRNLSRGISGNDVVGLQEFLRERGYFSANATGYFGPITAKAVAGWQASEGVQAVGAFGPLSRERLRLWCGGGGTTSNEFKASPLRGSAPLTTVFTTSVHLANSRLVADAGEYKIVFGDGSEYVIPCNGSQGFCPGPHTVRHTYNTSGTYTASLIHFGYFGIPGPLGLPERTIGSVTIYVGGQVGCTEEYIPVCGSKQVQCFTTPCNPVQQTYSNRCMMAADGATLLYKGKCRAETTDPSTDPRCAQWYDGCNNCSRETPGGLAACTLRACFQQEPAYCTAYFDNTTNNPPVIHGISGPTSLIVNQSGTWSVNASDPENGQLSYSVTWGDERAFLPYAAAPMREALKQTTTFTHAYSSTGTYTVAVVVRDSAGKEARTSTTVRVGSQFVACTADAMQCPDGSYVGRTGPNCQFVCSTTLDLHTCPNDSLCQCDSTGRTVLCQ